MPKSKRSTKQKKAPYSTKSYTAATIDRPPRPIINQNSKLQTPLLPKELLTHILTFTLTQSHPIALRSAHSRRWRNESTSLRVRHYCCNRRRQNADSACCRHITKSQTLKILLVSKAFYFSGIEAFYSSNTLQFTSIKDLSSFLAHTNTDRRKCIQTISLTQTWATQAHSWVAVSDWAVNKVEPEEDFDPEILKMLPNLKIVKVVARLWNAWFYDEPNSQQQKLVAQRIEEKVRKRWDHEIEGMLEFEFQVGGQS